jgi:hypothetical protein
MTCNVIKLGDEITLITCSRGQQRPRCSCGNPQTGSCDFPLGGKKSGQTCDRPLCVKCTVKIGPTTDYCVAHGRSYRK